MEARARRTGLWRNLLDQLPQSFRVGLFVGVAAAGLCPNSWSDDFRHAGRLGRTEPARLRFSDEAKPLNPDRDGANSRLDLGVPPSGAEEVEVTPADQRARAGASDQSNAWRLRWRQPQVAPVAKSTTKIKAPAAAKAVLTWSDTSEPESSHIRQVAQFAPADPFHDPFGDDNPSGKETLAAPSETTEISQTGQAPSSPSGAKPSTPGGSPPGGIDASPFPGTQLQPNDNRLVPGANQPIPRSNLPVPSIDSPFPAEERPQPGADRPFQPEVQPPAADSQPNVPNVAPDLTDPAPMPMDMTEPMQPESPQQPNGVNGEPGPPCDRTYNQRNCCTEDKNCLTARNRVRDDKISNILIDISPAFTNTDQELSTEAQMAKTLAEAPSRTWTDRQGKQLAQGRIQDFRNSRVHIVTDSGDVVKIPFQQLSDDDLCFFTAWWSLPTECPLGDEQFVPRNWLCSNLSWKASALCHKPLYFEEVALERYGHSAGPFTQPFISTAHFFGSLVSLPYQMGMHPPQECQYVLGYYRPGSCAPWLVPPFPVSVRGALAEAGAVVGGIYVIP